MPISRQRKSPSQQVITQVNLRDVKNCIGLSKHYQCAERMLRQAEVYRSEGHKTQLFFLLENFIRLAGDTIPRHQDFDRDEAQYARLRMLGGGHIIPEVAKLEVELDTPDSASLFEPSPAPDAQRLPASNLPSINCA